MNISNEEQPHVEYLKDRGYYMRGSVRNWKKGGVFVSFSEDFVKCLILRAHPLRKDTHDRKSQFNVVYRGSNPWRDMAFAEGLWRHLGLHIEPKRKKSYDYLNVDDVFKDTELLLKF